MMDIKRKSFRRTDIEAHREYLTKNVRFDKIASEMLAIHILTRQQYRELKENCSSDMERMNGFIDMILRMPSLPITTVSIALQRSGYSDAVDVLNGKRPKRDASLGIFLNDTDEDSFEKHSDFLGSLKVGEVERFRSSQDDPRHYAIDLSLKRQTQAVTQSMDIGEEQVDYGMQEQMDKGVQEQNEKGVQEQMMKGMQEQATKITELKKQMNDQETNRQKDMEDMKEEMTRLRIDKDIITNTIHKMEESLQLQNIELQSKLRENRYLQESLDKTEKKYKASYDAYQTRKSEEKKKDKKNKILINDKDNLRKLLEEEQKEKSRLKEEIAKLKMQIP